MTDDSKNLTVARGDRSVWDPPGAVHPNPHLDHPCADLPLAGRTSEPLPLRTALSNSFAFGGINASVVLRLPRDDRPASPSAPAP